MTAEVELLPLPEWTKRDDLGGLVPSEVRVEMQAYARACVSSATEALRAEVEKLQRAVPPGYALVPVEPTEDMQMAGDLVPPCPGGEGFGSQPDTLNIYRAMLAAAPKVEPVAQRDAEQRDEALLRQALDALEILRDGLLQMKEHAEDYGKRWAAAYIKELRDLSPGSAEEKFHLLGILQDRLAAVSMGVRKGYAAIIALRERLVKGEQQ